MFTNLLTCLSLLSSLFLVSNGLLANAEANCKPATLALDANGQVVVQPSDIDDGSVVPANHYLAVSPNTFDCSAVGTPQTVRLLVRDQFNVDQSACITTVTIIDNSPPTLVCLSITLPLDANGMASIGTGDIVTSFTDNCNVNTGSLTLNQTSFDCNDVGNQTVQATGLDVNGNTGNCTATVTIEDNSPPMVTCQSAITLSLPASGSISVDPLTVFLNASDNCNYIFPLTPVTTYTCTDIGVNTYSFSVDDVNGNSTSCSTQITIEDNIPPVLTCTPTYTAQLDMNGQAAASPFFLVTSLTDNCSATFPFGSTIYDCSDAGTTQPFVISTTDVGGNPASCTVQVTIVDQRPPTALCQNVSVNIPNSSQVSITAADIDAGSTDNCSIASLTLSQSSFDCSSIGQQQITMTATDPSGNSSTCQSMVTVADVEPPIALCNNQTVVLDGNGMAIISSTFIDGGSNDNCAIASVVNTPTMFDCNTVGANTVTLTVTDVNGNVSNCTAILTVQDNEQPSLTCPANHTAFLDANGQVIVDPQTVVVSATDNCTFTYSAAENYDCTDVGMSISLPITITDIAGNTGSCAVAINVTDPIAPTALCLNISVNISNTSQVSITTSDIDAGSSDNCSIASLVLSQSSFDCSDIGQQQISMTATDPSGNTSSCQSIVSVADIEPPTAICTNQTVALDGNGMATITSTFIDGGSSDNCAIASVMNTPTAFDCNSIGANTVMLNVMDVNGNSSSCTAIVTIVDNEPPTAVCASIGLNVPQSGSISISPDMLDGGSTDNCMVSSFQASTTTFTCNDAGTNTVTLTVTDQSANSAICQSTVTINCALPVEWGAVLVERSGKDVLIHWTTKQEMNNNQFIIEYSVHGQYFREAGKVDGQGTSQREYSYTYRHVNAPSAPSYYRIRQVDFDGSTSWSSVVRITAMDNDLPIVSLYPNPVTDLLNIQISELKPEEQATANFSVFDKYGRKVWQGNWQTELSTAGWLPGQYILQLVWTKGFLYKRFMKL